MILELSKEIKKYLKDKDIGVVSIYGIGSIAKKKNIQNIGDIDLNIFLENCSFYYLQEVNKLTSYIEKHFEKRVDINIIDINTVVDNYINSDLFPHKNRHSLFLYELKTLNCLLYGDDILKDFKINMNDIKKECVKLVLVQVHRSNKEILTKDSKYIKKNINKYCKYGIEFAAIISGQANPYYRLDYDLFFEKYPIFLEKKNQIIRLVEKNDIPIDEAYNILLDLSHNILSLYKENCDEK